jgi:hypothetical protein
LRRRGAVVGAAHAGAFVAGSLAERGLEVHLFDKRVEPWEASGEGRSVALSLSPRGLAALLTVGPRGEVEAASTELVGRAFHAPGGGLRVFETPEGAVRNRAVARAELTGIRCAQSCADVARRFLPGGQPRVYAESVVHEDAVDSRVPEEIPKPFEVETAASRFLGQAHRLETGSAP